MQMCIVNGSAQFFFCKIVRIGSCTEQTSAKINSVRTCRNHRTEGRKRKYLRQPDILDKKEPLSVSLAAVFRFRKKQREKRTDMAHKTGLEEYYIDLMKGGK